MRAQVQGLLEEAIATVAAAQKWSDLGDEARVERTKDPRHGDFTSNIAMRLAKPLKIAPRALAEKIVDALPQSTLIEKAEVAGPGFINMTLSLSAYHAELARIIERADDYGRSRSGGGTRVLVEYVSANPTGPLHVGHGRLAAFGASIASLLRAIGYEVDEEYYVNDAGRQMDILAVSVWLRYLQICDRSTVFPDNCYQGEYCRDIATTLHRTHGTSFSDAGHAIESALSDESADAESQLDVLVATAKAALGADAFAIFFNAALDSILADIRDDLAEFGVKPKHWYSEQSLADNGAIDRALGELDERGLLYARDGAKWFRTTDFGDDKDRVVIRDNGNKTYFASDIAYHREKIERGYDLLLNVLGADHHGYVARLQAALAGLGQKADALEVALVQFVALYRGTQKVQMGTRSGSYVTLRQLREEVGNDAARFFYVSRSNDQHLDFDLELAKARSNDNPVYYVQYAHARIASLLEKLDSQEITTLQSTIEKLQSQDEQALMVKLSRYGEVIDVAASNRAPQHVVAYLRELAAEFHSYYNAHRILVDDRALRDARIVLAIAVQQVIRNGLTILGVSSPEHM